MAGDVVAFELADVLTAAQDALLAASGASQGHLQGFCHANDVVGAYIAAVGASCLFETGTGAGHHGESALDGFDDGDAETFVARGVDKGFCQGVDGGEVVVGDSAEEVETLAMGQLTDIGGLATYGDEVDILGKEVDSLDGEGFSSDPLVVSDSLEAVGQGTATLLTEDGMVLFLSVDDGIHLDDSGSLSGTAAQQ